MSVSSKKEMERQLRNGKRTTLDDVVTSLKKRALVDTDRPRPNSPRPPPTAFQSIPPTALAQRVLKKFTAIYPAVSFSMASEPIDLSSPQVPSSPRPSSPPQQPLASTPPPPNSNSNSQTPSCPPPSPSPPSAQQLLPPSNSNSQTFTPSPPPPSTDATATRENFRVFRKGKRK